MNHRGPRALVVLAALAAAAAAWAPGPALGGEGPVVRDIEIRGFRGDSSVITDLMQTQEGQPLDPAVLNDDLVRLARAGYVATLRQVTVPDGVRLVIDVTESLRVGTIEIEGAGRSWNKKLLDEIVTRSGDPISPAMLELPEAQRFQADKARIRDYCTLRGYRATTVVSETERVPGTNQIDITFRVRCGPKYQVKWLRFEGNRGIAEDELRKRMQTKRDTWYTSRRYADQVFEEDIITLQDFYRFSGYPNARVTYRRAFRGRRGNKVDITIFIDEGQQYPTASIDVQGNEHVSTETILAAIPLEIGAPYADADLLESRQTIQRLYEEIGYAEISVDADRELTPAADGYNVAFRINEGDQITVRMVRTSGHPRTRREVILRELELGPGMVYDVRKLERSRRALNRLQYFDELTLKLVPTDPPSPGERDLLVDVTEADTGYFRFGLGFSSANAFIGAIELVQRNFDYRDTPEDWGDLLSGNAFVGAGQYFRIALYPGTIYSTYLVQYRNPYWGGRNQSAGWSAYWRSRDQDEWVERRIGVRLTRGIRKYKGDPDTDVIFHLRTEAVQVLEVDEQHAPSDAVDEEGTHPLVGLGVTVQRDRTDRPVLPTSGYKWEGGPELVVPHGVKLGAGGTRYWEVGERPKGHERVLSLRGRIDYGLGSFPIYERYYAGAPLIRGFEYRGAGPHDNGEPEGGQYRVVASAQYRYPLIADRLYTVAFVDTGTVTDDFTVFGDPRLAVGIGFRLLIPQISRAPLSLDLGVPVLKDGDDDTEIFYFSVSFDR
ncbi:MAG: BamA/OMP85 family outer membrane protein [Planctomycetota bacterium]